jgi:transposase
VQRPNIRFVPIKAPEQMDLLALHRVRSRLVRLRAGVINQIRGFLIERGIAVQQRPTETAAVLLDARSRSDLPENLDHPLGVPARTVYDRDSGSYAELTHASP